MALLTNSWALDLIGIIIALVATLVTYAIRSLSYWERRKVSSDPPGRFLKNTIELFSQKESFADFCSRHYNCYKAKNVPHAGIYFLLSPVYLPLDPEIIKHILQNDFNHFVDRGVYVNEEDDPLGAHLFSLEGQKWRNLRARLTPTFTSGKMKMMFETLVKCGDQLKVEMNKSVGDAMDIKDILMRFTTDIIGNCAFGIDCNSLKDPDNEFSTTGRKFFQNDLWDNFKGFLTFILPNLMRKFHTTLTKPDMDKFFMKVIRDTVEYREKNHIHRKDFMHLLLQLKNRGELVDDGSVVNNDGDQNKFGITFNELAAQAFLFFVAGFETSSTTMTFCLFELASNPDIQEKVRDEVEQVLAKYGNQLTYEAVMEMHYMEKVINETLRKYPPLPTLTRTTTKDYKVPGHDLVLEKGTAVMIPVYGLQKDEAYYPEPEKFDPERFSEENKRKRPACTFLPFGEGPRNCIGLRFGMMQSKVGLAVLLKNYKFSVSSKTHVPLKWDVTSFIMASESRIWLDYTKI